MQSPPRRSQEEQKKTEQSKWRAEKGMEVSEIHQCECAACQQETARPCLLYRCSLPRGEARRNRRKQSSPNGERRREWKYQKFTSVSVLPASRKRLIPVSYTDAVSPEEKPGGTEENRAVQMESGEGNGSIRNSPV